ncbi:MAG: zinc ribbon domain-containing protein [Planctomycetota bacterium]
MIYEYKCEDCDKITEMVRLVAYRDDPVACKCGGNAKPIMSLGSMTFNTGKGSRIPGVCHSLPGKSVWVRNKHHFRELCKRRDGGHPVGLD